MEICITTYETAWGIGALAATRVGLYKLIIPNPEIQAASRVIQTLCDASNIAPADLAYLAAAKEKLTRYFAGEVVDFTDLPLDWDAEAPFHKRVWDVVFRIPYGETRTYGEVAALAGSARAARAVGQAMARNPLPIIVPCHRVVGSDGKLTGFGGAAGLPIKQQLLEMEGVRVKNMRVQRAG